MKLALLALNLVSFFVLFFPSNSTTAEIYLGSGAKAGEITDRTAIIHGSGVLFNERRIIESRSLQAIVNPLVRRH